MRRREFIGLLGSAAAWPLAALAQQGERMRRIGVLQGLTASDPEWQRRLAAFKQKLQELGWSEGETLRSNTAMPMGSPTACQRSPPNLLRQMLM